MKIYSYVIQVLNGIPEQDLYYDVTDALEEQGIAEFISRNINNKQTDDDLLEQLRIYEVVLQHEDEGSHSRSNRESSAANRLDCITNLAATLCLL